MSEPLDIFSCYSGFVPFYVIFYVVPSVKNSLLVFLKILLFKRIYFVKKTFFKIRFYRKQLQKVLSFFVVLEQLLPRKNDASSFIDFYVACAHIDALLKTAPVFKCYIIFLRVTSCLPYFQ